MKYYIYRHWRLDADTVFYVGKGSKKRAWSNKSRNQYWKNIVEAVGYKVDIVQDNLTEEEAFIWEIEYINHYKSIDWCEANLTRGGLGSSGWKPTAEWIEACSKRNSGEGNPMYGKIGAMKGKKQTKEAIDKSLATRGLSRKPAKLKREGPYRTSEETKHKLSIALKGKFAGDRHPNYGKTLPAEHKENIRINSTKSKKVIDTTTEIIYNNVHEAAEAFKIKRSTLKNYLNGNRKNKTTLKYLKV